MDPALANEYVQAGTAMYQRAVDRDLSRVGIVGQDLADFYDHLRSNEPQYLRHALQRLALQGDGVQKIAVNAGHGARQRSGRWCARDDLLGR